MRGSGLIVLAMSTVQAALTLSERAPQQSPAFKTGVDLVRVDVSVLDRDRRPIRGLTAADFTELEDGRERPIVQFSPVDLLVTPPASDGTAAWLREVAPDVVSNEIPVEGRVVVVLFHQSIRAAEQQQARRIATAAIDALGPADVAAVMHVVNGVGQNLTRDRSRLLAAINASFMGRADTEAALIGGAPLGRGQCPEDRCSFEAITQIAESLRDVPRRKLLLLITPSFVLQSPGSADLKERREKMLRALDVANLAVYPIDPSGLETLALDAARVSAGRPSSDRTSIMAANLYRQGNLMALGERSGGRAIVNANEAEVLVRGIYDESQSYYTLAFQSSSTAADGRFHSISVRVNRREVAVHARKGHYAPSRAAPPAGGAAGSGPPPDLANAIERPWPSPDLPLEIAVAAFADPAGARPFAAITVRSTAGGPRPTVLTAAFDAEGRSVNSHWQALDLEPVLDGSGPRAYDLLSRLPLEPGRYEIRAAVRDERGAKLGTIATYLDVPDFAQAPLSLSGILLDVTPAPPAAPSAAFAAALPLVPSAQRRFASSDSVRAFARVYQGRGPVEPVTLTVTIQDGRGKAVLEKTELLTPGMFGGARVADYLFDLPLEAATAGTYRLRIVATRDRQQAARDVRFVVEPAPRRPS